MLSKPRECDTAVEERPVLRSGGGQNSQWDQDKN